MITIIHGDDITTSRNYYISLKHAAVESVLLDGQKISITDVAQALEGQDLFGETKQIFIEELLSKRKSSKELDAFISIVLEHKDSPVTLWESKDLTAKQISQFKAATVKSFKIPATIFALLDALRPKNGKQLVELFHKTLEDKDAEFVFFMLQRQIRILLAFCHSEQSEESLSKNSPNVIARNEMMKQSSEITYNQKQTNQLTISEVSRLAPWQKGKLEKQAGLFSLDKLLDLHSKIFDIELGLKTGNLPLSLIPTIDLLLLSL